METSKFKDNIPGFPGYHVTKEGLVYSTKSKYGLRPKAKLLVNRLSSNGYYRIGLYKDGKKVKIEKIGILLVIYKGIKIIQYYIEIW